jgi:hypothetical protein
MDGTFHKQLSAKSGPIRIVRAYQEPKAWTVGTKTSTGTFFCEGFGSHNCVAQHSVIVGNIVPPADAREGTLHDAAEAYLGDMVRPLKLSMPEYKAVELRNEEVIAARFGLTFPWPASVKVADNIALMTERRDVLHVDLPWTKLAEPLPRRIRPWWPFWARFKLRRRLAELGVC